MYGKINSLKREIYKDAYSLNMIYTEKNKIRLFKIVERLTFVAIVNVYLLLELGLKILL